MAAMKVTPPPADDSPPAGGLDALAAEAETTLAPPPAPGAEGAAPPVPVMTNAQSLMMGAQLVRETMTTVAKLKTPAVAMADEKLQPAADALGAVFDKHGWNLQDLGGAYMLEIQAAMAVGAVAWPCYIGVKAEIAASKAAKPAAEPLPAEPNLAGIDLGAQAVFSANDPRSIRLNG